jgi:hypothetical protein
MAKHSQPSSKRESSAGADQASQADAVEVIVKVHEPNYVPSGVTVRAQISPMIFTSVVPGADLKNLEEDPGVHSVSVSKTLRTIG